MERHAPVMRANRHTAPVRHFTTWPWFQHFRPSHKWQTKEMWLALKTCSRSDWKAHYQSGFFLTSLPISSKCALCLLFGSCSCWKHDHIWDVGPFGRRPTPTLIESTMPLWASNTVMETHLDWCSQNSKGPAKLFLRSKECAFAHKIRNCLLAQILKALCFIRMNLWNIWIIDEL